MSSAAPTRFTAAEYLALEKASTTKHELVDGAILAMAGARPPHNILAANVTMAVGQLARARGCVTMTSDQRVHVPATGLYTYPDVTVACGERRYDDGDPPSLLDPTILVEVTSDSTEDFDRGKKFLHYQALRELREYILVSHRARRIDHYHRVDQGEWHLTTRAGEAERVELPSLGGADALRAPSGVPSTVPPSTATVRSVPLRTTASLPSSVGVPPPVARGSRDGGSANDWLVSSFAP